MTIRNRWELFFLFKLLLSQVDSQMIYFNIFRHKTKHSFVVFAGLSRPSSTGYWGSTSAKNLSISGLACRTLKTQGNTSGWVRTDRRLMLRIQTGARLNHVSTFIFIKLKKKFIYTSYKAVLHFFSKRWFLFVFQSTMEDAWSFLQRGPSASGKWRTAPCLRPALFVEQISVRLHHQSLSQIPLPRVLVDGCPEKTWNTATRSVCACARWNLVYVCARGLKAHWQMQPLLSNK